MLIQNAGFMKNIGKSLAESFHTLRKNLFNEHMKNNIKGGHIIFLQRFVRGYIN